MLIQLLNAVYPLSPALEAHLRGKIKPYRFKKGQKIVTAGEVAELILYLETGLIRSYSMVNNKKATNYFMREQDIIISVESFIRQEPALESIEPLEDCACWGITYTELQQTYKEFIEFNINGRVITEEYYCRSEARHRSKHRKNPEEMYEWLMATDPELLRRVKASHIASYLDVSNATYHNIKRDYALKKR